MDNHDGLNFVRIMTLSENILKAIFIDSYTNITVRPPSARESQYYLLAKRNAEFSLAVARCATL